MKLYITAAGVYVGTQAEAKRDGKGWRPEEVPVDKYGLIDYLNKLKFDSAKIVEVPSTPFSESISLTEQPLYVAGDPLRDPAPRKPAFKQVEDGHFRVSREAVLQSIANSGAGDLGYYAMEIAARFETISKASS